jgi:predicted nucleic acid-binding protein
VTGSWTRIEVSGALIRAARRDRQVDVDALIASLDADLAAEGPISVVGAPANEVEGSALALVREHGLRTLDAWHLATARLTVPKLAAPSEPVAFATRDAEQASAAEALGFIVL